MSITCIQSIEPDICTEEGYINVPPPQGTSPKDTYSTVTKVWDIIRFPKIVGSSIPLFGCTAKAPGQPCDLVNPCKKGLECHDGVCVYLAEIGGVPDGGDKDPVDEDKWIQVGAGDWHTCGVKTDGSVACWGFNVFEQSIPPAGTFTQVSAGYAHTCGVKRDESVACWGNNDQGQSTPPNN